MAMTYEAMTNTWQTPAVLVFPGQGSQWTGMAVDLIDGSPTFAARLRECAAAVEEYVDWSVEDVLRLRGDAPSIDLVEVVQPVLFCVHVALAEMWMACGLRPGAVVGQSQGEVAAACVAGVLTLDDAAHLIVARSRLFAEELVGTGGMASVGLSRDAMQTYLSAYDGRLEIAGIIGPRSVTIAGAIDALEHVVARLTSDDVWVRAIPASIPSHCAALETLRERLGETLGFLTPRPGRIPVYSTVFGCEIDGQRMDADYWYANARQPVLFEPATRALLDEGYRVLVESSAHPVLTAALKATAEEWGASITATGTLRRGSGGLDQFNAALATVPVEATPVVAAA